MNVEAQQAWRRRCYSRLLRAIGTGQEAAVACALKQGGRYVVHDRDENGLLPLHRAIIKAPSSVVHLLVQAGANPESTFEGLASLHMACGRGRESVVRALLSAGADRDARTAQGFTALHCASGRGGLGAVRVLLSAGADVNVRSGGWQRRTPLHAAATLGDRVVTEELLQWGANVNMPDAEGVTSLHIAAAVDNLEVARCLLEAGASTEAMQTGTLNRPLHLAAFQGSYSVLAILLQAGADFSATNAQLETPLHHACSMMDVAIIALLLHRGADESLRNTNNQTCADVLGLGLDEQAGGGRGDPLVRQRISVMLARAPAERAWRRRSWIVMMRARKTRAGALNAAEGVEKTKTTSGTLGLKDADPTEIAKAPDGRDEKHRCCGTVCGTENGERQDKSQADVDALRTDEDIKACLSWVVRAHEEGIFREVVSFL